MALQSWFGGKQKEWFDGCMVSEDSFCTVESWRHQGRRRSWVDQRCWPKDLFPSDAQAGTAARSGAGPQGSKVP